MKTERSWTDILIDLFGPLLIVLPAVIVGLFFVVLTGDWEPS